MVYNLLPSTLIDRPSWDCTLIFKFAPGISPVYESLKSIVARSTIVTLEPGVILQEIQAGYMLGERLLRPALVGVAKKMEKNKDKKEEK